MTCACILTRVLPLLKAVAWMQELFAGKWRRLCCWGEVRQEGPAGPCGLPALSPCTMVSRSLHPSVLCLPAKCCKMLFPRWMAWGQFFMLNTIISWCRAIAQPSNSSLFIISASHEDTTQKKIAINAFAALKNFLVGSLSCLGQQLVFSTA